MNKKMSKRQRDLKSKLMAAICMLLVSSIMMVSTTYAWFTLSTAPEVTGITTSVGANGNLEMALLPTSGNPAEIGSSDGDSNKPDVQRNVTWGNLVDLSDNTTYGLNSISLYPAALNLTDAGAIDTAPLKFPSYGPDGRVDTLVPNTYTGIYNADGGTFSPDNSFGVRAVGSASGMTDRQLSYRNARGAAQAAASYAAQLARQSLNTNGNALADIAIKKGTNDAPKFNDTDIASMQAIITDLTKDNGVLDQIEKAYMQYLLALGASKSTRAEDTVWKAVKGLVEAENATLATVKAGLNTAGIDLAAFPALNNGITKYESMLTAVGTAQTKLDALTKDGEYEWAEISPVLNALANPDKMEINGIAAGAVKENMTALINSVIGGKGVEVTLTSGAGIYADIADQTTDFRADVAINKIEYGGQEFGPVDAKMVTEGQKPSYLDAVGTAVTGAGAPDGGAAGSVPITDMYGYIIDMAFRTNAASSNLLLQVTAADRIYSDNTTGVEMEGNMEGEMESTMGNGANMTFTPGDTLNADQLGKLMGAVRLVFFDPDSGNVIKYAKLDTANATSTAEGGLKANIVLCDKTEAGTSTVYFTKTETGNPTYTVYCTDDTLATPFCRSYTETTGEGDKTMWQTYTPGAGGAEGTWGAASETQPANIPSDTVETEAGLAPSADQKIMPLTQNTATKLSVLVYIDGEHITNADVAAGASSCTSELNIQFASDANLTPMNYTPLMNQGGTTETTTAESSENVNP